MGCCFFPGLPGCLSTATHRFGLVATGSQHLPKVSAFLIVASRKVDLENGWQFAELHQAATVLQHSFQNAKAREVLASLDTTMPRIASDISASQNPNW